MSAAVSSSARPHTYPRATPTKRPALSCGIEPWGQHNPNLENSEPFSPMPAQCNGVVKGAFARYDTYFSHLLFAFVYFSKFIF